MTKLYEGEPLPENKIVHIEGIYGIFGWGRATAICRVDEHRFDPCLLSVDLLPGKHTIEVRYLYGNEEMNRKLYRTYVMDFPAGSKCNIRLEYYSLRRRPIGPNDRYEHHNLSEYLGDPDRDPYIECRAGRT